jgi:ABC-type multidrug transport system fused ATPase/permease subunit
MNTLGRVVPRNGTVVASSGERLRGVPVWIYRYGNQSGATAHFETPAFYAGLVRLGVNAIRVVCFDVWQQANGYIHYDVLDPAEMALLAAGIDTVVEFAATHGLYAMIDYHSEGSCDPVRLHAFWLSIAPRYAARPHVFYELANEPVSWFPRDYTPAAIRLQEQTYALVRASAPDTHIVLFSFANTTGAPGDPSMADVVSTASGIDWSNASVGFHPYTNGHSSEDIRALMARFPVLNTEMNIVAPVGSRHHAQPMDGHEWGFQTMESIGVSWFAWDTETPSKFKKHFVNGILNDAARKQYRWPANTPAPSAFALFRRTFPFRACAEVMRFTWRYAAACVGLHFLAALTDAVMLAALLPFAQGMMQGNLHFLAGVPVLSLLAGLPPGALPFLLFALGILLLGIAKNTFLFGANLLLARGYTRYSAHLSSWAIGRFLSFGKGYYDRHGAARIGTVIDHHNDVLGLWQSALHLLATGLMLAAYLAVMLLLSPRLTLVVLILAPALQLSFRWAKGRTAAAAAKAKQWNQDAGLLAADIYRSLPLYRAFGREASACQKFTSVINGRNRATTAIWIPQELLRRFQDCAILLALLSLLVFSLLVNPDHARNMPVLIVFFYVARVALPQITQMHDVALALLQHIPGALDFASLFGDGDKFILPGGTLEMPDTVARIEIKNLTFAYPAGSACLRDVSFSARRGDLTALTGPSGAGKSTLLHLLPRFYDAPPGAILFDGVDIRLFSLASLRRGISLVSQDSILLRGSVRHNLSFGMEEPASDEELWQALRGVGLESFVRALPLGLNAPLGDGAAGLSGGQRQRIAIARALLKRAPILLLDEPSSAVDAIAEDQILQTLQESIPHSVVIAVTHRQATVERAGHVVVFDEGQVVEQGTPAGLTTPGSLFYRMFPPSKVS